MASFFLRAATGQYELEQPTQLVKLLVGITRNKLAAQARKQRASRRDHRRVQALDLATCDVATTEASPSQVIAGRELLEAFRQRLRPEEQQLADLRAQADEKQDRYALETMERVAKELGLDEGSL